MCKTTEGRNRAYDRLSDILRGEVVTDRRAIFERDGDAIDLVAFFTVLNGTVGNLYEVHRDGDVERYDTIPYYGGMGNRKVMAMADVTCGYVERF